MMGARGITKVTVLAAVLAALLMAVFGCGGSSAGAAMEDFLKAAQNKDCEKMVDMMDLSAITQMQSVSRDQLVESCKSESASGEILSYKILEEKVEGDKAEVKVEVTTKSEGQEDTESDSFTLNKKDGAWKISLT